MLSTRDVTSAIMLREFVVLLSNHCRKSVDTKDDMAEIQWHYNNGLYATCMQVKDNIRVHLES